MSSLDHANRGEKLGLVWRNRKKISQIIKDYLYLPFFLLIILIILFRFEANLSEYGSYSLHKRMFQYIRKHHLFASFASYTLQNIRTDWHTNIRF
jgi:hypothetical protein